MRQVQRIAAFPLADSVQVIVAVIVCSALESCGAQPAAPPAVPKQNLGTTDRESLGPPSPAVVRFSANGDRAVTVALLARSGSQTSGPLEVQSRNALTQSAATTTVNLSGSNPNGTPLVLPSPWQGELRIVPLTPETRAIPTFLSVVIEPIIPAVPGLPPRLLYGPHGRSSVRFDNDHGPPAGTNVVFTSPSPSAPPADPTDDSIEIGFVPTAAASTTTVIGLSPLVSKPTLVVHLFDPKTRAWVPLASHAGRDGAVYATGPVPGIYALKDKP